MPTLLPDVTEETGALSGARKAAVLLVALGVETASKVLRSMNDEEVEAITLEIARIRNVSSEVVEVVLKEFNDMSLAQRYIAQGGMNFAREALDQALGTQRAEEVLMRVEAAMEVSAFHLLQTVETAQLINFIQNEHPQTAALILSHLKPKKAADVISEMPAEQQAEIMYRLATMGKTAPELLRDIEEVIRQQMGAVFGSQLSKTGGAESVASILNAVSRTAEKNIMEAIRDRDPEMAGTIKELMFVFDDLVNLGNRDLQRILAEVDAKDLALALKAAAPELETKLLKNVSERAASMIREEMELIGSVRVRDVEQAQRRVLEVAQLLEEQGELSLSAANEQYV